MDLKSTPTTVDRFTKPAPGGLALRALALSIMLSLLLVRPAASRWDIPQTAKPLEGEHSSPAKVTVATPTPTPTPLVMPEQAEVPILMYHYVSELPPNPDVYRRDLTVLPQNFREQLQYLSEAGYHAITLSDLYLYFTQAYPLPDKPVVLTFDDGYADAYEIVFPLLLEYGYTGTFFVLATPTHLESPGYLTWAQMQEMAQAGMEIQAHGRDHVDLRGRSYDFLVYQILGIQEAIHYHTGILPRFFCYPGGQYDADVIAVVESAGYWGAVTTQWGKTHTREGLFELTRVRIRGSDTLAAFISKLED